MNESVPAARARSPLLRWLIIAGAVIALLAVGRLAGDHIEEFKAAVERLGLWGPLIFMLGYVALSVAFVPGSVLTLAAGAIFGVAAGTAYVFVAATGAACLCFLIARYFARAAIERRTRANPRFTAIDRAIADDGLKITFLLRLSPVFPFTLLNYALGLTRVRFGDYAIASVGMLPGTLLYVYLGSLAGLAAGAGPPAGGMLRRAFFVLGLLATALVTVLITRTARRALDRATTEAP